MILFHLQTSTMDTSNFHLLHKNIPYGMLQLKHYSSGQKNLKPHVLSHAIDQVYAAFFYSDHAQQIEKSTRGNTLWSLCDHSE